MSAGFFEFPKSGRGKSLDAGYAVIDIETSGLSSKTSRVLEIAVVTLNKAGEFEDEISTLINPGDGNVGPKHIHHISEAAIEEAPSFEEFSPLLKAYLSGRVAVAHNAIFEDSFLSSEFSRFEKSNLAIPCIDSLALTRKHLEAPNYKLGTVLEVLGIESEDDHTALGDARSLSEVVSKLLDHTKNQVFGSFTKTFQLDEYTGRLRTRVTNLKKGKEGWMAGVLRKLPYSGLPIFDSVAEEYFGLLERFLKDGKLTEEEVRDLLKVAGDAGWGSSQIQEIHRTFFELLEKEALKDGEIDKAERKELDQVSQLLHL
jgi:DNA polymerase III subunit epsilon